MDYAGGQSARLMVFGPAAILSAIFVLTLGAS